MAATIRIVDRNLNSGNLAAKAARPRGCQPTSQYYDAAADATAAVAVATALSRLHYFVSILSGILHGEFATLTLAEF